MGAISFVQFSGIAPRLSPYKLPQSNAQIAKNVRLAARTLKPWNNPLTVVSGVTAGDPSTIYRFGHDLPNDTQYWFAWPVDVDVVKGALANDATERTYFTHPSDGPRYTNNSLALTGGSGAYPWNSYKLGVAAPTLTPAGVAGGGAGVPETRVYVFTYVTSYGEEGPPSPVSSTVDVLPGGYCDLSNLGTTAPTGYGNITAKRIYRTLSGSLATEFQFVDEIPIGNATYRDTKTGTQLQEVIPSVNYDPPPASGFGICQMANGITLIMDGYDIYPSEAYLPHAYPPAYRQTCDYPIVGAKSFGSMAVIGTTGVPYLLYGSDPSALTLQKLQDPQACVSKRSMCVVPGGVMYASPDGLVMVDANGSVTVATDPFMTRDEWQTLVPSSIRGYVHDGRYIGFYNTGSVQGGFVFEPREGDAAITLLDAYASAGYSDLVNDSLYLQIGTDIVKWHAGAGQMTYTWKSRLNLLPYPDIYSCAQVIASAYPVTFKLYGDGVLKHTQTVASRAPFRLTGGSRYQSIEVELSGTAEVAEVHVAHSIAELKELV
jgi:hypothetical protein